MVEPPGDESAAPLGPEVREALFELQRYLSDSIAPLMVAESVEVLLDYPADLAAHEINAWTTAQFRGRMGALPLSDYLFHAVDKIHQLGLYKLLPLDRLGRYLDDLVTIVLSQCPEEDRDLLRANLARLGEGSTVLAAPVDVLHRQVGSQAPSASGGRTEAVPAATPEVVAKSLKRFTLLLERWEAAASGGPRGPGLPGESSGTGGVGAGGAAATDKAEEAARKKKRDEELLSQLLANAVAGANSDSELANSLEKLRRLGLEMQTAEAFRVLGRS
ncbi:MAG TPA: hypothetical protein VLH41_00345, partial [Thermoanaerobaculia bacterium]|nr:hypothetical protein [Thermoanaerobaculia bacterium]